MELHQTRAILVHHPLCMLLGWNGAGAYLCSSVSSLGCPWAEGVCSATLPIPRTSLLFCRHLTVLHAKMCSSSSASGVGDSRALASLSSEWDREEQLQLSILFFTPPTSVPNKHVSQHCCASLCQGLQSPGVHTAPRLCFLGLNLITKHADSTMMDDCHNEALCQEGGAYQAAHRLHCPSISGPSSQPPWGNTAANVKIKTLFTQRSNSCSQQRGSSPAAWPASEHKHSKLALPALQMDQANLYCCQAIAPPPPTPLLWLSV